MAGEGLGNGGVGHWTDNPDELRTDVFYLLK
jgi:hypothetical protein